MVVSRSLAFEAFLALTQICEFYSFAVFQLFSTEEQWARLFDDSVQEAHDSLPDAPDEIIK